MEYVTQQSTMLRTGEEGFDPDQTFEDFLKETHMLDNPTILDDELPDSFNDWVSQLDKEEVLHYANQYTDRNADTFAEDFCKENGIE